MKPPRLIYDYWSADKPNDMPVVRPKWQQFQAAINALDGDRRTCLTLCGEDDGPEIVVGGGPEKFAVSSAFSDEEIYRLKDKWKAPI